MATVSTKEAPVYREPPNYPQTPSMPHQRIDHIFFSPRLAYDAVPNRQPYIRLSFFFQKLPTVSYEHFYRHWETVHADLTIACATATGAHIGRYTQIHAFPELRVHAEEMGIKHVQWDACSEMYLKKWKDWQEFTRGEVFARIREDTKHFQMYPIQIMIGTEYLICGEAIPALGGMDGILPVVAEAGR